MRTLKVFESVSVDGYFADARGDTTTTLTPTWSHAERLEGDLVDAVKALKAGDGPPLVVLGSGSVAAALGAAGLVDEVELVVVPTLLGEGKRLFAHGARLRLVAHRAFANGNVVLTYAA